MAMQRGIARTLCDELFEKSDARLVLAEFVICVGEPMRRVGIVGTRRYGTEIELQSLFDAT